MEKPIELKFNFHPWTKEKLITALNANYSFSKNYQHVGDTDSSIALKFLNIIKNKSDGYRYFLTKRGKKIALLLDANPALSLQDALHRVMTQGTESLGHL